MFAGPIVPISIAAAIAAFAIVAIAVPAISAVPRPRWRLEALAKLAFPGAVWALIAAVVVGRVTHRPVLALVSAAAATLAYAAYLSIRYAPIRAVKSLARTLRDPARRASAVEGIDAALDRSRPDGATSPEMGGAWAGAVLIAAGHLYDEGLFADAWRMLQKLAGLSLQPIARANQAVVHALVRLHLGDVESADAALASVARPISLPMLESMALAAGAMSQTLAGRHDVALRTLETWAYSDSWHARARLETRAHAHAALGDEAKARRTLHELERRFGRTGLECAAALGGAVAPLANELLSRSAPYR